MERQLAERAIANQNSSLLVSAEGSPINRLRERVCIDLSAHRQLQLELYSAAALNHARGRSSCVRVDVWDELVTTSSSTSLGSMIWKRQSQPIGRLSGDGQSRRSRCARAPGLCKSWREQEAPPEAGLGLLLESR